MEQQLLIEIKKGNRFALRKLYGLHFDYAIRVATAVQRIKRQQRMLFK